MKFTFITLFPQIIEPFFANSIMKKAVERGIVTYQFVNPRDFATDNYHTVDDKPFGGGAGQLLKCQTMGAALDSVGAMGKKVLFPTPTGAKFDQKTAKRLSSESELVIICARYEGLDQRVIDLYNCECVTLGDYVMSSGEVAALAIIDSVYRLIEGVITDESLSEESFSNGLLEYPQYTKPALWRNIEVPKILLSGNHEAIRKWRLEKSVERTLKVRKDLVDEGLHEGRFSSEVLKVLSEKGVDCCDKTIV